MKLFLYFLLFCHILALLSLVYQVSLCFYCELDLTVYTFFCWAPPPPSHVFLVSHLQVRSHPSRERKFEILLHLKLGSLGHFYRHFGVDNAVKNLQLKCAPFSELFRRCICQIGCFLHLSFCQRSVLSRISGSTNKTKGFCWCYEQYLYLNLPNCKNLQWYS